LGGKIDFGRLLIFGAVIVGAFVIALGPIADGDIYWHLAAGREMFQRKALLRTDPFTLSAAGRPWVDVHWLFQLVVYALYRASGFVGLVVAKAALVAGGAMIATLAAERSGGAAARAWCAMALLGTLFLARHLLPIRPVIVTLVFLAVFLWTLESSRATSWSRWSLFVLPLVQLIWGNCQGLSLLGPALIAAYLMGTWLSGAGGQRAWPFNREPRHDGRPLAIALGVCVLASFFTPYGLDAVALPGRLFARLIPGHANVFSANIAENVPPFILERTAPEQAGYFKWILAGLAVALAIVRPRLRLEHLLLLVAFGGLALMANRNVLLFYWIAAPVGAIALAPVAARRLESVSIGWMRRAVGKSVATTGLWAVLAAELTLAGIAEAREPAIGLPTPFHFPVESVRVLAAMGTNGSIFAPDQHGGYLTFTLPSIRPYIDTRLVLHTGQEYADYLSLFQDHARFDALAIEAKFNAVVLTTAYPDLYLGLIRHLANHPAWRLVFTDGYEVLFAHAGAPLDLGDRSTIDTILNQLAARFAGRSDLHAAARLNLARLLVVLDQSGQTEYVLSGLDSRPAAQLRARAYFSRGRRAAAESIARILLRQNPRDVRSLTLLAQIAMAGGRTAQAEGWLRQAVAVDPYDSEARTVVGQLEESRASR
jgi:hypothetical protein